MEAAGIHISDLLEFVGEIIINITPRDKELANEWGYVLDSLKEADSKLKSELADVSDMNFSQLLKTLIDKSEGIDDRSIRFLLLMLSKKAEKLDKLIADVATTKKAGEVATPKKAEDVYQKPVLKKITPIKNPSSYECNKCCAVYASFQRYKEHVKEKHGSIVTKEPTKATCMLQSKNVDGEICNTKLPLGELYRHLYQVSLHFK